MRGGHARHEPLAPRATIARWQACRARDAHPPPRAARWPGSGSPTARRSWPGPYCTMLLADLGADVIKVEPPEGDATRGWGPPWVGDEAAGTRTAAYFLAVNRNKRSIRLDLKRRPGPRGPAPPARRLGRPGRELPRRGAGPARVRRRGADRPEPGPRPPRDLGLRQRRPGRREARLRLRDPGRRRADVDHGRDRRGRGRADQGRGRHQRRGHRAVRDRLGPGRAARAGRRDRASGQRIDVSLLESTLAMLVNQAQNAFVGGVAPQRMGNAHPNLVPYETFRTADGELAVAVGSERQWPRLCEALGLPGLAADPWYATNGDRVVHRADLRPILASRFASHATADWAAILDRADIPWGAINDVTAAFATPQAVAREMVVEVEHPVLGAVRQVGLPFRLSATPASIRSAPPLLGEHAAEILAELGYGRGTSTRSAPSGPSECGGPDRARAADDHLPDPAPPGGHRRPGACAGGGDGARCGRRRGRRRRGAGRDRRSRAARRAGLAAEPAVAPRARVPVPVDGPAARLPGLRAGDRRRSGGGRRPGRRPRRGSPRSARCSSGSAPTS